MLPLSTQPGPPWIIKTAGRWSHVGGPVRVRPVLTNNIYVVVFTKTAREGRLSPC